MASSKLPRRAPAGAKASKDQFVASPLRRVRGDVIARPSPSCRRVHFEALKKLVAHERVEGLLRLLRENPAKDREGVVRIDPTLSGLGC